MPGSERPRHACGGHQEFHAVRWAGFRHRLFVSCQQWADGRHEHWVESRKRRLLADLKGKILEIGPGTGINFRHFPAGIEWHGLEPNVHMYPLIRAEAARFAIRPHIHSGLAGRMPFDTASFDAVVATLVLCSVRDIGAALDEVTRVLRPGGRYYFLEHVGAEPGSPGCLIQRAIAPLWSLAGGGCRPDKDTLASIRRAPFSHVAADEFDVPVPVVRPHIAGYAEIAA